MVCDSCQIKGKSKALVVPDKWKDGARNVIGGSSTVVKAGKTNKIIGRKLTDQWIPQQTTCKICKSKVQLNMNYCNDCAHKKGICTMCGKKIVDTSSHNMSLT